MTGDLRETRQSRLGVRVNHCDQGKVRDSFPPYIRIDREDGMKSRTFRQARVRIPERIVKTEITTQEGGHAPR